MREIKFRGYRKDIGWKYGYLTIIEKPDGNRLAIKPTDEHYITYGIETESVGQYTELNDKNGKEIYEGDIVKRGDAHGEVYWSEHYCGFVVDGAFGERQPDKALRLNSMPNREVIGNIYENPELIGVVDKR